MSPRTKNFACIVALIFFAACASAAPGPEAICANSTTTFCSGFEEGNLSIWDDYDGNPAPWNSIALDPGPLNLSGNHVTILRVPAGRGGTDLVKVLSSPSDKLYVRWYQKWESDYDFSAPNHGGGFHAGDRNLMGRSGYRPSGTDWFSYWVEPLNGRLNLYTYYAGMYQDCSDPAGSCWGDHFPCFLDEGSNYCTKAEHRETVMPPLLQAGRWYCIESMVDAGTPTSSNTGANGRLDMWIDDVEYGPWNGLWLRSSAQLKISELTLGIFHHGTHSVGGVVFDNVVISTQRVGCASSGKQPNPPTNVTVR